MFCVDLSSRVHTTELRNKEPSPCQARRRALSGTATGSVGQTLISRYLAVFSSTLNLSHFSFSKTKPLGGKRKQSDRVPCGWSLGVIGGGPAGVEEGFLLETNWNNLACWTWKALKFFVACEHYFLTISCAMHYPLPAPADSECCCCSVTPPGLLGP